MWKENYHPLGLGVNYVFEGDGFAVSFNPNLSTLGTLFDSDDGGPETALIQYAPREYFILNGDFRSAYERLVPQGWAACKAFYDQQSAHADSSWSTAKVRGLL